MERKFSAFSPLLFTLLLHFLGHEAAGQCAALSTPDYKTGKISATLSGCLPLNVVMHNDLPGATNTRYLLDYRGGPIVADSLTADSVRVYRKPGFYTIIQFSEKDGQKYLACTTVEVTDTLAPTVRAVPCANGGVQLVFDPNQPTPYPTYQVDWGDTEIKGYPGFGKKITYQYAAPQTYSIRVRGVHTPGQCRGAVTRLNFAVSKKLLPPVITEARMRDNVNLDLKLEEDSLATELILQKGNSAGVFDPIGNELDRDRKTVATTLEPGKNCFRLQPADSCLAQLRSEPICASDFSAEGNPDENTLSWKIDYRPPGLVAVIQRDGIDWKEITATDETGFVTDREFVCGREVCYQLVVKYRDFVFYSPQKCLTVPDDQCDKRPPFFMPDAFSPNGDGLNDFLEVKGLLTPKFTLTVYNGWGTVVFQSADPQNSWDGRYHGQAVPAGTYAYALRYLDRSGAYLTRKGSVLLMK